MYAVRNGVKLLRCFTEKSDTLQQILTSKGVPNAVEYIKTMLVNSTLEDNSQMRDSVLNVLSAAKSSKSLNSSQLSVLIGVNSVFTKCRDTTLWLNQEISKSTQQLTMSAILNQTLLSAELGIKNDESKIYNDFSNYIQNIDTDVCLPEFKGMLDIGIICLRAPIHTKQFWDKYFVIMSKLVEFYSEQAMKEINQLLIPLAYHFNEANDEYKLKINDTIQNVLQKSVIELQPLMGLIMLLGRINQPDKTIWSMLDQYIAKTEVAMTDIEKIESRLLLQCLAPYYKAVSQPNPIFTAAIYSKYASSTGDMKSKIEKFIIELLPIDANKEKLLKYKESSKK